MARPYKYTVGKKQFHTQAGAFKQAMKMIEYADRKSVKVNYSYNGAEKSWTIKRILLDGKQRYVATNQKTKNKYVLNKDGTTSKQQLKKVLAEGAIELPLQIVGGILQGLG